jgi:electron transfer flavoprotein beta subunit
VNIVVCVKRVPDTAADKKLDPQDFTLDRETVDSIINPVDEYAVEEALRLKEQHGGEVAVLTMGPEGAEKNAVRKALCARGRPRCAGERRAPPRLGRDGHRAGLASALRGMEFDLVLLGSESTDAPPRSSLGRSPNTSTCPD